MRRAAEEGKGDAQVVREFSEADGKVTEPPSKDGNFYNDERPVRCEHSVERWSSVGRTGSVKQCLGSLCVCLFSGRARHPARAVQFRSYVLRDRSVPAS